MHVLVDLYVLICQIGLKCHLISIFNILSMYMYHLTRVLQVWLKGFIGNTSSKKDHLRPNYTPCSFLSLLFFSIVLHPHSFSASITCLDRSFLHIYTLFLLRKVLALKNKGFLSFWLVVCSKINKDTLLICRFQI